MMQENRDNIDDWQLAEETAAGDDQAFDALVRRYRRPVLNFAYRLLNDAGDAEDVAQEAFAKLYRNLRAKGVRRKSSAFSTWLFQVARNTAIDRLRWKKRRPANSLTEMQETGWDAQSEVLDPRRKAVDKELGRAIARAVNALPEKQREVLVLYEYQRLSYNDIAEVIGGNVKAVETRLYRARKSLRKQLAEFM